jgi:hypothetical protein
MINNEEKDTNVLKKRIVERRGDKIKADDFSDLINQEQEMEKFLQKLQNKSNKDPTITRKQEKEKLNITSYLKQIKLKDFVYGFYNYPARTPEEIEILDYSRNVV